MKYLLFGTRKVRLMFEVEAELLEQAEAKFWDAEPDDIIEDDSNDTIDSIEDGDKVTYDWNSSQGKWKPRR